MYVRRSLRTLLLAPSVLLAACPPEIDPPADDDTSDDDTSDDDTATSGCDAAGYSDVEGLCLDLLDESPTWTLSEAAAGVELEYLVRVDRLIENVVPRPLDAGRCGQPDSTGLIVFADLSGAGQHHCLCDVGLCMGEDLPARDLAPGEYPATWRWDGLNFSGPSDTGNEPGPPFPVGEYTLSLRAEGTVDGLAFEVWTTTTITIVP